MTGKAAGGRRPRQRAAGGVIGVELPASLNALREQAAQMLQMIDQEKARCYVQQMSNGHGDDECFSRDGMGEATTYAQRREQLEESERRLRDSLPPAVLKEIDGE